ncbi:MAG: hypothetical protein AAF497_24570, partial [Planctomycetota bacterium]
MFSHWFTRQPRHPHLLFVCTANLCRSPMAEAICRVELESRPWNLSSAGFFSDHALPPVPEVLALLKLRGLSGNGLTSMRVTKDVVKRATNIYAMTEMHLATLKRRFPKEAAGARLVTEFSTLPEYRDQDVPDPIGGNRAAFEEIFTILNDAIPPLSKLKHFGKEVGYALKESKQSVSRDALKEASLLYLLGPTKRFADEEKQAVIEFVRDGGSLLVVVDESRRSSLAETQVNDMLSPFGLKLTSDTEYVHNCGGVAKAGTIHKHDLEIPFSGGRSVEGGTPFAFQIDRDGDLSHPFATQLEVSGGGR